MGRTEANRNDASVGGAANEGTTGGLLKDISLYFPALAVPAIVGVLSVPVLTRLFDPGRFAEYAVTMAAAVVVTTLMGWLPMATMRFFAIYDARGEGDIFRGVVAKLAVLSPLATGIVTTPLLLFSARNYPAIEVLLWSVWVMALLRGTAEVLLHVLRASRQVSAVACYQSWFSAGGFLFGLGMVLAGGGIEYMVLGNCFGIAVALPVLWRQSVGRRKCVPLRAVAATSFELARYSLPLVATNLGAWGLRLSDRCLIERLRGPVEAGVYAANYNITETFLMLLSGLFVAASGPILIRLWERDGEEAARRVLSVSTRWFLLICIPAAGGIIALRGPIVHIMTGESFRGGAQIVPLVACGAVLLACQQQFQYAFLFRHKTHLLAWVFAGCAIINVGLNVWLVPDYGYIASGWVMLASYAVLATATCVLSRRLFEWPFPVGSLIRATTATVVLILVVRASGNVFTGSHLWLLGSGTFAGCAAYVLCLLILGEFSQQELAGMWRVGHHVRPR